MPTIPPASLSEIEIEIAYNQGAEAHKRAVETIATLGTKYTDTQVVHLLAFCGLSSMERDLLPEIWSNIQSTKGWFDAGIELTKWFKHHEAVGDVAIQYHKELVKDVRKLMFSLGLAPLADHVHMGVTPLAFVILTVGEENQLREDQEAFDGATSLTPAMMRASKRNCPSIPTGFDQFDRLLIRYIRVGQCMFTRHCQHFTEVNYIRQELMMMYKRNTGHLPSNISMGLLWDIITDAAQFFFTFTSEADFATTPQENMPTSMLSVRRSILSANLHVPADYDF